MAAYKWKDCLESLYPVPVETAVDELDRLYKLHGEIRPETVVDASRAATAPLHPVFEWNDTKAAELYRKNQAAAMIRAIVVIEDSPDCPVQAVRAFVHTQKAYQPITVVLEDRDMKAELLHDAYRDMMAFVQKYQTLKELYPVFRAIKDIENGGGLSA